MKIRLTHPDKLVMAEFAVTVIATILFLAGVANYFINHEIYAPIWGFFAFFILAKSWIEFYETTEDRRVHTLTDEEMKNFPSSLRRQAD